MESIDAMLAAVLEILESGPKSKEEIFASLLESGMIEDADSWPEEFYDVLEDNDSIWTSFNGLCNRTDHMLDGACFTHRLSEGEIVAGMVDMATDLTGLDLDLSTLQLPSGEVLEVVFSDLDEVEGASDDGSLRGPEGWLRQFLPGELVVFQRLGSIISVYRPDEIGFGEEEQAALERSFEAFYEESGGIGVESMEVLLNALCEDHSLFKAPVPSLSEMFADLGFECRGAWLGRAGDEWQTPGEAFAESRLDELFERYGFERCCESEFELVSAAWSDWLAGNQAGIDQKRVLKALGHGLVPVAFTAMLFQFGASVSRHEELDSFMTSLASVNRSDASSAYYVRAVSRSLEGKALMAEKDLRTAIQLNPENELAKLELATYVADRGDIVSYISRLRSCTLDQAQGQIELALELLPKFPPTERNAPCPCGSGLKYKACCMVSPKLTPQSRRAWMVQKIARWMSRPERITSLERLFSFFESQTRGVDTDDHGVFVLDVAIFEGGGVEDYLEMREELLSPDDAALLVAMAESVRSLYEVTAVVPGESLTLRDTVTGETTEVIEHSGSMEAVEGDYLLGRVIDSPEGPVLMGQLISIELRHRDSVLELLDEGADPLELLSWMAGTLQLPKLFNFEGDEISFCRARIDGPSLSAVRQALSSEFEDHGPDQWSIVAANDKLETVSTAHLAIEDGSLVVETNSVPRLEAALARLRELLGEFEITERKEVALEDALSAYGRSKSSQEDLEPSDELREALDAHLEKMEDRWIDDSIPALGGFTPREALADPTRKEDLLRLLNEFERHETRMTDFDSGVSGGFNVARLRSKLGL